MMLTSSHLPSSVLVLARTPWSLDANCSAFAGWDFNGDARLLIRSLAIDIHWQVIRASQFAGSAIEDKKQSSHDGRLPSPVGAKDVVSSRVELVLRVVGAHEILHSESDNSARLVIGDRIAPFRLIGIRPIPMQPHVSDFNILNYWLTTKIQEADWLEDWIASQEKKEKGQYEGIERLKQIGFELNESGFVVVRVNTCKSSLVIV